MPEPETQNQGRLSATVAPPDQGAKARPKNKGLRRRCRRLTPPQIAQRYGVSPDKVLRWIRTGELKARPNLATRLGGPAATQSRRRICIWWPRPGLGGRTVCVVWHQGAGIFLFGGRSDCHFFPGAQLLALGIIGEYLARMHFRMMERPTYTVREEIRRAPQLRRPHFPGERL